MKPSILFWFYKDVEVCKNRLQLLRRYNPETQIFGLYGGRLDRAALFESALAPYLDDFFCYADEKDAMWKWLYGDLVIREWYRLRGRHLAWQTLFIAQWDMLVFGSLADLFDGLQEGQMLLSNLRSVDEVKDWWHWSNGMYQAQFELFFHYMRHTFGYDAMPLCCQFVIVCLPRRFLDCYSTLEVRELGFIEYRVPAYAQLCGIPFSTSTRHDCWWEGDPDVRDVSEQKKMLSARKEEVSLMSIVKHYHRTNGTCIVHPYRQIFPLDLRSGLEVVRRRLVRWGRSFGLHKPRLGHRERTAWFLGTPDE